MKNEFFWGKPNQKKSNFWVSKVNLVIKEPIIHLDINLTIVSMEKFEISLKTSKKLTDQQIRKLQEYFNDIPIEEILAGLHFAKNRWTAKDAGVLKVGRKSIIKREIHSITSEQAQWRLKNWKMMIANYRKLGYSYPTISRIKKILQEISKKKSK